MKNILLTLSTILGFSVFSQSTANPKVAIQEIKEGVLVVNLITPQTKINTLLRKGQKEESLALTAETERQHQEIIKAFTEKYTFGQVLFVNSNNMGRLADGDATALFAADGTVQKQMPKTYYIVELSTTDQQKLSGLVVRDNMRDMLDKPFPNFVSMYSFLNIKTKPVADMVEILNKKFNKFYTAATN